MINKTVSNVQDALQGIENGMTLMLGGFGLCGIPENSIAALVQKGVNDLTCISNNAGVMWEKMQNLNAKCSLANSK